MISKLVGTVSIFVLLWCSTAKSQMTWTKHEGNPIIPAAGGDYSAEPAVIQGVQDHQYQMWYAAKQEGRLHIYYALSDNGLDWFNYTDNPVLSPGPDGSWDGVHVRSSAVLFVDGEYRLYYSGSDGYVTRIGLATSPDGVNWEKSGLNPIIDLGDSGEWDDQTVYHPKVVIKDAEYFMWFAGSDGSYIKGGLANSQDGIAWEKYTGNPVLVPGPAGSWDEYRVWPSSGVAIANNVFNLFYTGVDFNNASNSPIGLAQSEDGIHWQKSSQNPVLLAGNGGEWDEGGMGNSSVIWTGAKFRLWYGAHDYSGIWQIGYAESSRQDTTDYVLQFDGIDDVVRIDDINNSLDLNDFTIEAWVYRLVTGANHMLVSKSILGEDASVNSNFWLWIKNNNRAEVGWELPNSENFYVEGTTEIKADRWYHIAGVRNASTNTLHIFVNGQEDAAPATTFGQPNNQDISVWFGDTPGVPNERHKGLIDEVRIWNTPRSEVEILETMNLPLAGWEPHLVGYWRLNEGYGQIVHDLTSNGNHGHLGHEAEPDSTDPIWVISSLNPSPCSGIPLPSAEAYGKIQNGDQAHVDKVTFCFESFPDDAYLSFQAYDVDTYDEVDVRVNGTHLFDVPVTAENSWSGLMGVLVPQWLLREHEANELVFDNTKNPPKSWYWGVRQVSIDPFYALPSNEAFGKIPGGDQSHADKVVYIFSGQSGDLSLSYEVYDIDSIHELDLILNGEKIDDAVPTANNSWSSQRETSLPDWLVNDAGLNVLVFENTKNPPLTWNWGVRNVGVEIAGQSSALVNLPEGTLVNGNLIKDGNYVVDGVAIPLARANGDDSPNTNAIEGAALISPSGHLVIDLGNATEFDGVMLQPEWNHERFVSYRIESSLNGADWRPLVDNSDAAVHGVQFSKTSNSEARFLRITGSSHIANVEALPANGSEDRDYWREYDAMIASSQATDLALAELRLFRTQGTTSVNERESAAPTEYDLEQNFPNPFNPTTTLRFSLPQAGHVKLQVYDVKGELVRTVVESELAAGYHAFSFDASGLASGTYYYRLEAGEFVATRKMILMR